MAAEDGVILVDQDLTQPRGLLVLYDVASCIGHGELEHTVVAAFGTELLFGSPDTCDLGVHVDDSRYRVVAHAVITTTYDMVDSDLTLTDSGMSEHGEACDIPSSIDAGVGGLHVLVHHYGCAVHLDREGLKA